MSAKPKALRLDRLLGNLGYGSRKAIQALAAAGRIMLDGEPLRDAGAKVELASGLCDRLVIDGTPLDPLPGVLLMMHKPLGATCSHKDAGPLVYALLPDRWRARKPAISTVGRLDKDTSGLLLLTDDGGLLHRIIAPKSKVAKRYRVTLARPLRGDEAEVFASGTLMLDGETTPLAPAVLEILAAASCEHPTVNVTITEGRYHQVRRMFAALGNHVTALHRDRVGGLDLPSELPAGAYRLLSQSEIEQIFA
jgi:16S rRNA pseudouridine516 synthase